MIKKFMCIWMERRDVAATNKPNYTIAWIDCIWWHCDIVHHKSFSYYWANSFGWIWQMIHFSPCREKKQIFRNLDFYTILRNDFPAIYTGIALDVPLILFFLDIRLSFARFPVLCTNSRRPILSTSLPPSMPLPLTYLLTHSFIYLHFVRLVAFYLFHFSS